jgi:hypothetical protein
MRISGGAEAFMHAPTISIYTAVSDVSTIPGAEPHRFAAHASYLYAW